MRYLVLVLALVLALPAQAHVGDLSQLSVARVIELFFLTDPIFLLLLAAGLGIVGQRMRQEWLRSRRPAPSQKKDDGR